VDSRRLSRRPPCGPACTAQARSRSGGSSSPRRWPRPSPPPPPRPGPPGRRPRPRPRRWGPTTSTRAGCSAAAMSRARSGRVRRRPLRPCHRAAHGRPAVLDGLGLPALAAALDLPQALRRRQPDRTRRSRPADLRRGDDRRHRGAQRRHHRDPRGRLPPVHGRAHGRARRLPRPQARRVRLPVADRAGRPAGDHPRLLVGQRQPARRELDDRHQLRTTPAPSTAGRG
jgi:hypothetical protein